MQNDRKKTGLQTTMPDLRFRDVVRSLVLVALWVLILAPLSAADSSHAGEASPHHHDHVAAAEAGSPFAVSQEQSHHDQETSEVCYFHKNNLPCPHHKNKASDSKEICIKQDCPPGSPGASVNLQLSKHNPDKTHADFSFAIKEVPWSFPISPKQHALLPVPIDPPPRFS